MPRTLLVTTVKDEGPWIFEWVAHHLDIGFDKIIVYQNNSFDETPKSLRTLARAGAIDYYRNHSHKDDWQPRAYRRVSRTEDYAAADWCLALDADEFLYVNVGDGTVQDLLDAMPDTDQIVINWRLFGTNGRLTLPDELVTESFVRAEPADLVRHSLTGHKTMFRARDFVRPGIHWPRGWHHDHPPRRHNASALRDDQFSIKGWCSTDPGGRALAQINHYRVRDLESFVMKSFRGSAVCHGRAVRHQYFASSDRNEAEDLRLAQRAPRIRARMAELNEMTKGRLEFLRGTARRLWRERLDEMLQDPEVQSYRAELAQIMRQAA